MDRIIRVDLVAMASSRSFPVALASARQARAWLAEVIAPDELAVAERQRFEVALTELITNLVQHTAPTPETFRLRCQVRKREVRVLLTARCHSFPDAQAFRAELQAREPDEHDPFAESGRGLMMVRHYFPDARYTPPPRPGGDECYELSLRH